MDRIILSLIAVLALLVSLSVHEYCHGLVAYLLGDGTAKRMGRLTLNPLAHLDPVGTVLVPLIGMISGLPVFGWAKPVPYNPYNLRYQRWGPVMVALAGPVSNFVGAGVYLVLLKLSLDVIGLPIRNLLVIFLAILVMVNVLLGLFNFIPVHPLDGAKLLDALLSSPRYTRLRFFLETRGPLILLAIIFIDYSLRVSILGRLFFTVLSGAFSLAGLEHVLNIF